jgi:hypothetical protein
MSEYSLERLRAKVEHYGECMFVLESDREYDVHNLTVTWGDLADEPELCEHELRIEGMHDHDHLVVDVPAHRVEHVYAHREL